MADTRLSVHVHRQCHSFQTMPIAYSDMYQCTLPEHITIKIWYYRHQAAQNSCLKLHKQTTDDLITVQYRNDEQVKLNTNQSTIKS